MLDCEKGVENRLFNQATFITKSATHIFGYEIFF